MYHAGQAEQSPRQRPAHMLKFVVRLECCGHAQSQRAVCYCGLYTLLAGPQNSVRRTSDGMRNCLPASFCRSGRNNAPLSQCLCTLQCGKQSRLGMHGACCRAHVMQVSAAALGRVDTHLSHNCFMCPNACRLGPSVTLTRPAVTPTAAPAAW